MDLTTCRRRRRVLFSGLISLNKLKRYMRFYWIFFICFIFFFHFMRMRTNLIYILYHFIATRVYCRLMYFNVFDITIQAYNIMFLIFIISIEHLILLPALYIRITRVQHNSYSVQCLCNILFFFLIKCS